MGRAKGKGKKQNTISTPENLGNGKDESNAAHRRRGRPMKPTKENPEEEEEEEEPSENAADLISNNDLNSQLAIESGKKRKRGGFVKGNATELVNEEKGELAKPSMGFRQNGSRRKNKPRRAAEAMVECM